MAPDCKSGSKDAVVRIHPAPPLYAKEEVMARDYKSDYAKFQSSPEAKKDRAARNKKRRELLREGRVRKGDNMDVDHKDGNPRNSNPKNIQVIPRSKNRAKK